MMTVDYITESLPSILSNLRSTSSTTNAVIDRLETVVIGALVNKSNAQHW